jgi:putative hemolysin
MNDLLILPQVIALFLLLVFSAFFAGSETALMAVSRLRLRQLSKTQPNRVKAVEKILNRPEKLIGTILLGNNLVNIAMSAIATAIAISIWGNAGIIYVTVGLTIIILIFADTTPKVYAKYHNADISLWVSPYLRVIMAIFNPIVIVMTYITTRLLIVLGIDIKKTKHQLVTEAEVKTLINLGWEDGVITSDEKRILSRVFTLNDKTVEEIMIPKKQAVVLRTDLSIEQAIITIKKSGYSRYPVKKGKSDEIIGFIYARDLLGKSRLKKMSSLKGLIRPAIFTSSGRKIDSQLRAFRTGRSHQAVVLDESGEFAGIITLEDIIEQMVGSIEGEHDDK